MSLALTALMRDPRNAKPLPIALEGRASRGHPRAATCKDS